MVVDIPIALLDPELDPVVEALGLPMVGLPDKDVLEAAGVIVDHAAVGGEPHLPQLLLEAPQVVICTALPHQQLELLS